MADPLLAPAQNTSIILFAIVMVIVVYILWKVLSNK